MSDRIPQDYWDSMVDRYGRRYGFPDTDSEKAAMRAWIAHYWQAGADLYQDMTQSEIIKFKQNHRETD